MPSDERVPQSTAIGVPIVGRCLLTKNAPPSINRMRTCSGAQSASFPTAGRPDDWHRAAGLGFTAPAHTIGRRPEPTMPAKRKSASKSTGPPPIHDLADGLKLALAPLATALAQELVALLATEFDGRKLKTR